MNLDLDDAEQAALIRLLRGEVENTRYPLSPRLRTLRSILAKLGVETRRQATRSRPVPAGLLGGRRECAARSGGDE